MNRASELGPKQYDWWPDWRDECVAIIGSGYSTKESNIALLKDRIHVIAIKVNVDLAPWAEICYGCDVMWWSHKSGLPAYKGIKISQARTNWTDIKKITVQHVDKILTEKPLEVGSGGNSGFQALNLAIQFGCTGILLIGFDCHGRKGEHWYGRNLAPGMNNPVESNFKRWRTGFAAVAKDVENRGVQVINASEGTALTCFDVRSIDEALEGWGL